MTGLIRAELARMRGRRGAWFLGILAVAMVLAVLIGLFLNHRKAPTANEQRVAQRAYEAHLQYCTDRPQECPGYEPQLSDYLPDQRFHLNDADDILYGVSIGFVVLSFLLGGTFLGAEWHHGLIGHQLLWEPRRPRVLLAKGIVGAGISAAGTLAAAWLLIGGLYLVTALRGTSEGTGPRFFGDLAGITLRAALLAAILHLVAFGLASLTRSTAAAIGLGFALIAVLERVLGALRPGWRPWLVSELGTGIVLGEWPIVVPGKITTDSNGFITQTEPFEVLITWRRGALVLALYVAVLLGLGILDFRRRDVT